MNAITAQNIQYTFETFHDEDGAYIERHVAYPDGHDVEIIKVDGDAENVCVKVDDTEVILPESDVKAFIYHELYG